MAQKKNKFLSPNTQLLPLGDALLRVFLVYVTLNAVGLWIAKAWCFDRPLFNLDYVFAALIYIWISRTLASVALVVLFLTECVRYLIPTYFFSQQSFSLFFWARALMNWSPLVQLTAAVLLLAVVLLVALLFRRYRLAGRVKIGLTIAVLAGASFLTLLDSLNGTNTNFNFRKGGNWLNVKIVGSPLNLILRKTLHVLKGEQARFDALPTTASATGRYFSEMLANTNPVTDMNWLLTATNPSALPPKLVVVVFESLSVPTGDPQLKLWREPFARVENRYDISAGTLDWFGATLRGEIRELCWQALDGQVLSNLPPALPATLKKLGYATTAFHGFYAGMYDRARIYPLLGFDQSFLLETMQQTGPVPRAGTVLNGARDDYVAKLVHQDILRPGKRLTYWLTLTSHSPVNFPFAREIATPAELAAAKDQPEQVWAYKVICRKTLDSLAEIAADPALENCDFIIVGDHSLPATSEEIRSHLMPKKVAYLILRHKK